MNKYTVSSTSADVLNRYIHISNLCFVMQDLCLISVWQSFIQNVCHFQLLKPTLKWHTLCAILRGLLHIPFWGQTFQCTTIFMKSYIPYFNASPSIFKYRQVYLSEATLNVKSNVDMCSIPLKFHMRIYDRINIYPQNCAAYCSYVSYEKPLITEMFEGPSYTK